MHYLFIVGHISGDAHPCFIVGLPDDQPISGALILVDFYVLAVEHCNLLVFYQ